MTDEDFEKARIIKAALPFIKEKVDLIEKEFVDALLKTKHKDDEGRRDLVAYLQITKKVLEYLESDVRGADKAQKTLKDVAKLNKHGFINNMLP